MAAPKGNKNASKSKDWEHTLRRVLMSTQFKDSEGKVTVKRGQALAKIAEMCVTQAMAGDKDARQEIANRLDGKPMEHVQIEHTDRRLSYAQRLAKEKAARAARAPAEATEHTVQ